MGTPSPKALTASLVQHWDVMERLCAHAREMATFELEEIERVIARASPRHNPVERAKILQDLSDRGLVQRMPRSDRRRVHPDVLTYVQRLTRERDLGLSAVIKARIERIHQATIALLEAIEHHDRSAMVAGARQLWQQFDDISTQLDQDRHAIFEIADRAKAKDASLPLLVRYRNVLEAYDQYVEPMVQMMDSGPGGVFQTHLQDAGEALDHGAQALATTHGTSVTETRILRDAAFQARELRRLGRDVMNSCASTLLPLRNELRDHSTLAASIATVAGLVRKRGARRVLPVPALPFAAREIYRRIGAGPELRNIMAAALNYTPPRIVFPEPQASEAPTPLDVVDLHALREGLATTGTDDLLAWIAARHPHWQDVTVLAAFHALSRQDETHQAHFTEIPVQLDLQTIRVTHHPAVVAAPPTSDAHDRPS